MKKLIILLFSSCLSIISHAQSPYFEYLNIQSETQYVTTAIETDDGDFIVSSMKTTDFYVDNALKLIKLSSHGNFLTEKTIQSDTMTYSISQMIKQNTGFVTFGRVKNLITNEDFLWYAKFDNNLNLIEEKKHYFQLFGTIMSVGEDEQNNFILTGSSPDLTGQFSLPYIIKLNNQGNLLDSRFYIYGLGFLSDMIVRKDTAGYILFDDRFVFVDTLFNISHIKTTPFPIFAQGSIKVYQDSLYLVAGKQTRSYPNFNFIQDIGIGLISADFSPKENDYFGLTDTMDFSAIFETMDYDQNTIYCGGNANIDLINYPISDHTSHFVLAQYDENLNRQWLNYYGGDAYYIMFGLLATSDGGCLMYGHRYDFNVDERIDLYVLKVDANGNAVTSTSIPIEQTIEVNVYPNPFTNYFEISTTLNKNLEFKLFNAAGQIIKNTTFYNTLEINDLQTAVKGIYFYTITDENRILKSGKLVKR